MVKGWQFNQWLNPDSFLVGSLQPTVVGHNPLCTAFAVYG